MIPRMLQTSEKIWMDGTFVAWADAQVHVLTHSLHYGLAAFEGIRCYKGRNGSSIFRLSEHVDRLFESAHIALIEMPYDKKQITEAIVETVRINRLEACYIRPLVYIGYGAMGLYPGGKPHQGQHCRLEMGDIPRGRGTDQRNSRKGFLIYPPPRECLNDTRKDLRLLCEFHPC